MMERPITPNEDDYLDHSRIQTAVRMIKSCNPVVIDSIINELHAHRMEAIQAIARGLGEQLAELNERIARDKESMKELRKKMRREK